MDDDGESICRSRSKLVVTCLCAWLILQKEDMITPRSAAKDEHVGEAPNPNGIEIFGDAGLPCILRIVSLHFEGVILFPG